MEVDAIFGYDWEHRVLPERSRIGRWSVTDSPWRTCCVWRSAKRSFVIKIKAIVSRLYHKPLMMH